MSRSHSEFLKFAEAVSVTCPQAIVPALPLAQTSAATDDEDDRLVKYAFQKWVARICSDPAIMRDDELRSFIESDFSVSDTGLRVEIAEAVELTPRLARSTPLSLEERRLPAFTFHARPSCLGNKMMNSR